MGREKVAPEVCGLGSCETTIAAGEHLKSILPRLGSQRKKGGSDGEQLVTVVDRRVGDRFEVHRRVIDDWRSVIGLNGLGLYVVYCALAGGAGSEGVLSIEGDSLADLRRLFVWIGLIQVVAGGTILLLDAPARSRWLLEDLAERLRIACAVEVSPIWTRALGCVRALLRGAL